MKKIIYLLLIFWSITASAHKPSDSYLSINIQNQLLSGRWDIALRDLDFTIGLDNNDDGAITWGELQANLSTVSHYAFSHLQLVTDDKQCSVQQEDVKVDTHTDGKYVVLFFNAKCKPTVINTFKISYRLFADVDSQHRGLLKLNHNEASLAAVLVPNQAARIFDFSSTKIADTKILDFIQEGIWHIWIGFDHILFLFSLLIPSVMIYRSARWLPVTTFKEALWDVVKVVTAFTLAHSITLSVAVLGYVDLPSRWVESVIAASVIVAATNNFIPVLTAKRALLAFIFGLIHGFGFASVLTDLGLPETSKLWSLLGFNVGVEIGQLALVLIFLPLSYKLSRYPIYQPLVLRNCSIGIASIAGMWLIERAFDISINSLL